MSCMVSLNHNFEIKSLLHILDSAQKFVFYVPFEQYFLCYYIVLIALKCLLFCYSAESSLLQTGSISLYNIKTSWHVDPLNLSLITIAYERIGHKLIIYKFISWSKAVKINSFYSTVSEKDSPLPMTLPSAQLYSWFLMPERNRDLV